MAIRPEPQSKEAVRDVKVDVKVDVEKSEKVGFDDDELVTVLYGYGRVRPDAISYLDDYVVKGGVIRDVPYRVAKHWKNGTRPDGQRVQGKVKITIVPADAPESAFLSAVGLSESDLTRLSTYMAATDAEKLLEHLSPEQLARLREALSRRLAV